MNALRTQINTALDALIEEKNGFAFQRLASQCLRSRWPSLASVAERADLGEDSTTILGETSDWGLVGLKDAQRQDLLEILDDRDGNRSTIITSQLPIDRWHEHLLCRV